MGVQENLLQVRQRMQAAAIRTHRDIKEIQLIAVSKMTDMPSIEEAIRLGIQDFGENRTPQLKQRQMALPQVRWHMIGRLQTNKVKEAVEHACLIHSVDRYELAQEINKRAEKMGKVMPCLLEVNVAGEEQKAGIRPQEALDFLTDAQSFKYIQFRGLMTMAPDVPDQEMESVRPVFRGLYQLRETLREKTFVNSQIQELSMGMSHDFEIAIEEGATMVRVGSAIFLQEK